MRSPSIGLVLLVSLLTATRSSAQGPTITSLNLPSFAAGGPGSTLIVNGTGFAINPSSVVRVNGANRATVFLGVTQLQATILASDIVAPGSLSITVFNLGVAGPGITSNPVLLPVVNLGTWQLQRLLAPPYGAGFKADQLPLLRWTPVPGAAKYQVGFSPRLHLSTVEEWHDATDNQWAVPKNVWDHLPEGDLYWTVRTVEISGETRKPVPMRLLRRFPAKVLSASAERPRLTSAGNPLLEWKALKGRYVYRVTISADPEGSKIVRRYLTANPQVDLRALAGKWDPAKSYYWRVDAVTPEGRTVLRGPTQMFIPPTPQGPRSSREERPGIPGLVLASYRTSSEERYSARAAVPLRGRAAGRGSQRITKRR